MSLSFYFSFHIAVLSLFRILEDEVVNLTDPESGKIISTVKEKKLLRLKKDCGKKGEEPHLSLRLGKNVHFFSLF